MQDAGELGIAGVRVVFAEFFTLSVTETVSDQNGFYSFNNVAPGPALVQVSPIPDGHIQNPGTLTYAIPNLAAGQNEVINFSFKLLLPSDFATVQGTVFDDTNNNGVQDAGELGLQGVQVFVVDFLTLTQTTVTTDADGLYTAPGILPDNVLVQVSPLPAGFIPSTGFTSFVFPPTLPLGSTTTIDFALRPVTPADEATITIDVFDDANSNGIKDSGEGGVEGAVVFTFELLTQVADVQVTDTTGITVHAGLIPDVVLAQINAVILPAGFTTITTQTGPDEVSGAEFVTLTPGQSVTVQIGLAP